MNLAINYLLTNKLGGIFDVKKNSDFDVDVNNAFIQRASSEPLFDMKAKSVPISKKQAINKIAMIEI